jgi:hypothetical protein
MAEVATEQTIEQVVNRLVGLCDRMQRQLSTIQDTAASQARLVDDHATELTGTYAERIALEKAQCHG